MQQRLPWLGTHRPMTRILGMLADKGPPWQMTMVALFSNHRFSARSFALFSNAFETSPRSFVHSFWRFFRCQWGGTSGCCTPREGRNGWGPGAVCVLFRVSGRESCAVKFLLEVRGSVCPVFAGPAVSPADSGRCRCRKDSGTPAPSIGGNGGAPWASAKR